MIYQKTDLVMKNAGTRPVGSTASENSQQPKTPTNSSQYTYSSYTTYGTYTANGSSVSYSVNETNTAEGTTSSNTSKARVRVKRKRDENGNYIPHSHEHTTTGEGHKRKHRVLKHADGVVAATYIYPSSTMSNEELNPVSTSDLKTTMTTQPTEETASSFTIQEQERHHHHHKGYDREHHKWCYKKRKEAIEKLHPKPKYVPEDQTFTELGTDEPRGTPRFSKYAEPPDPTTTIDTATCVDTEIPEDSNTATFASTDDSPIPRGVLFPVTGKVRGLSSPKRTTRGVQGQPAEEEREWDPNEEKELRALVEKVRDHLYPRRRRPNASLANRSVSAVDQQSAYGDNDRALAALMSATKTKTAEGEEPPPFAAPKGPVCDLTQEQREFNGMQRYLEGGLPNQVDDPKPGLAPSQAPSRKSSKHNHTHSYSSASKSGTYSKTGTGAGTETYTGTNKTGTYTASYESVHSDDQKLQNAKRDNLTSVEMLVTANSKSGEFVEASEENPEAVAFVEMTTETKPESQTESNTSYSGDEEEDEEEDSEEEDYDEEEEEEDN